MAPASILSALPLLCLYLTILLLRRKDLGAAAFFKKAAGARPAEERAGSGPEGAAKALPQDSAPGAGGFFQACADGCLIWSAALWLETNCLSALGALYPAYIRSFWIAYSALAALALLFAPVRAQPPPRPKLSAPLLILCLLCLACALIYPPNNWDAQSYHLPRVMQWLQNHSLAPFFTNIPRQTGMPPFNAMIALQMLAFGGGDYFINLIQWTAYIGSLAGAAAIAGLFGGAGAKAFAALFIACAPGAVTQASTFESSLLVSFWLLAYAYYFFLWRAAPSFPLAIRAGACLGFAILTKGSAYPIALPFVLFTAFLCLRRPSRLFLQGCLMALIITAVNAPHLARNHKAFGDLFGGAETNILRAPSAGTFALNAAYNFLAHEPWLLKISGDFFLKLPEALGLDASDKSLFPWGGLENLPGKMTFDDSYGQNPLGAAFILIMGAAWAFGRFRPPPLYAWLLFFSFASYFLFLTWHPWTGRVHLSLFALSAPLAGLFLASWRPGRLKKITPALFFICGLCAVFLSNRPLAGLFMPEQMALLKERDPLYIASASIRDEQLAALDFLAAQKPRSLGLVLADNSLEYPVWRTLEARGGLPPIIHMKSLEDRDHGSPELVWMQEADEKAKLLTPKIFRLDDGAYRRIYP